MQEGKGDKNRPHAIREVIRGGLQAPLDQELTWTGKFMGLAAVVANLAVVRASKAISMDSGSKNLHSQPSTRTSVGHGHRNPNLPRPHCGFR